MVCFSKLNSLSVLWLLVGMFEYKITNPDRSAVCFGGVVY